MAKTAGKRIKTTVALDEVSGSGRAFAPLEEGRDLQDIVADALVAYLRTRLTRKEGGR